MTIQERCQTPLLYAVCITTWHPGLKPMDTIGLLFSELDPIQSLFAGLL